MSFVRGSNWGTDSSVIGVSTVVSTGWICNVFNKYLWFQLCLFIYNVVSMCVCIILVVQVCLVFDPLCLCVGFPCCWCLCVCDMLQWDGMKKWIQWWSIMISCVHCLFFVWSCVLSDRCRMEAHNEQRLAEAKLKIILIFLSWILVFCVIKLYRYHYWYSETSWR